MGAEWRSATCRANKCVCPQGLCALDGKCLEESKLNHGCLDDTGGRCSIWACDESRGATCKSGRCLCLPGYCALGGKCLSQVAVRALSEKAFTSREGSVY